MVNVWVIALSLVFAALLPSPAGAQVLLTRVFLMNPETLVQTQRAVAAGGSALTGALRRLQKDADKVLAMKPVSVMDKSEAPPSGDKHDYLSLARYYWPDPSKADGLPYIQRDGEVNPECESVSDHANLELVIKGVSTLGMAYFYTAKEEYAERAALLLRTWFLNPDTRMNPNLNYGQIVRGKNVGRASGLIDVRDFPLLIDGVGLLAGSESWTLQDQQGMVAWFTEYLQWLQSSPIGMQEAKTENNHSVWLDVQRTSIALFVGRADLARSILEEAKTRRISRQIEPDGTQPRELARTRSMHYTAFNLRAFFSLAALGDHAGVDLWRYESPDGRSIRRALDWFLPYYTGDNAWEQKQIDAYKPETFLPVLHIASRKYGDARYLEAGRKTLGDRVTTDRSLLMFGPP